MGKSLRSNRIQKNKTKLRTRVFGPVEDARVQRLSQKLVELASSSAQQPELDNRRREEGKDPEMEMAGADDEEEVLQEEGDGDDDAAPSKDVEPVQGTSPSASLGSPPAPAPPFFKRRPHRPRKHLLPTLGFGSGVSLSWSRDGFVAVAGGHVDDDDEFFSALGVAEGEDQDQDDDEEEECESWRAPVSPWPVSRPASQPPSLSVSRSASPATPPTIEWAKLTKFRAAAMDIDSVRPASKRKPKTKKEQRVERKMRHRKVKNRVAFPTKKRDPRRRGPRI
jgi:hypothetical protein